MRTLALTATAVLGCLACSSLADPPSAQQPVRQIWDSATGTWVTQAEPKPGTAEGDLALAKAALAEGQVKQARAMLDAWLAQYADSPLRPQALLARADVELEDKEYIEAYKRYEAFLNEYPAGELFPTAVRREIVIAEVFLAGKKRKVWGIFRLPAYDEAIDILDRVIDERSPGTELAEQALKIKADYLYGKGEFEQAEQEYARLARDYPLGRYHQLALVRAAQAALASFPGTRFDDAPLVEAQERFRQVKRLYPDLAQREGVDQVLQQIRQTRARKQYEIGQFYQRTGHPDAAAYYLRLVVRDWPETTWAAEAQRLLGDQPLPAMAPAPPPTSQPAATQSENPPGG